MPVPKEYGDALAEIDRLFETGKLTKRSYDEQARIAFDAIKGDKHRAELVEAIALLDPDPG